MARYNSNIPSYIVKHGNQTWHFSSLQNPVVTAKHTETFWPSAEWVLAENLFQFGPARLKGSAQIHSDSVVKCTIHLLPMLAHNSFLYPVTSDRTRRWLHSFAVESRQESSGKLNATQASLSCGSMVLLGKKASVPDFCFQFLKGHLAVAGCVSAFKFNATSQTVPNFSLIGNLPAWAELFLLHFRHFILILTIQFLCVWKCNTGKNY